MKLKLLLIPILIVAFATNAFAWEWRTGQQSIRIIHTTGGTTLHTATGYIGGEGGFDLSDKEVVRIIGGLYADLGTITDSMRFLVQTTLDGGKTWANFIGSKADTLEEGLQIFTAADAGKSFAQLLNGGAFIPDSSRFSPRFRIKCLVSAQGTNGTDTSYVYFNLYGIPPYSRVAQDK